MRDAEKAAWLADKIVAQGDYAKEAAELLRRWPDDYNLSEERRKARQQGFLEGMSASTSRNLAALLRRGLTQLYAWQILYGEHQPQWLPPAGDVRWAEDVAEALDGRRQ